VVKKKRKKPPQEEGTSREAKPKKRPANKKKQAVPLQHGKWFRFDEKVECPSTLPGVKVNKTFPHAGSLRDLKPITVKRLFGGLDEDGGAIETTTADDNILYNWELAHQEDLRTVYDAGYDGPHFFNGVCMGLDLLGEEGGQNYNHLDDDDRYAHMKELASSFNQGGAVFFGQELIFEDDKWQLREVGQEQDEDNLCQEETEEEEEEEEEVKVMDEDSTMGSPEKIIKRKERYSLTPRKNAGT
jgi:hypothetical protein